MNLRYLRFALVSLHGLGWGFCLWNAQNTLNDALWTTVWNPLLIADFPVSVVLQLILLLLPETWIETVDIAMENTSLQFPYSYFWGFWLPAVLYGAGGTVWWHVFPTLIVKLLQKERNAR